MSNAGEPTNAAAGPVTPGDFHPGPSLSGFPGSGPLRGGCRMGDEPFYESPMSHTNGTHHAGTSDLGEYPPANKRHHPSAFLINPSPLLFPLHAQAHLFDYPHPYHTGFHTGQSQADFLANFSDRGGREQPSSSSSIGRDPSYLEQQRNNASSSTFAAGMGKHDDEWKNINTMLNCILSMVEKTKRALAILQQRGNTLDIGTNADGSDIKRMASEIMAATVRQTEERVADVRRRAEDAVNQVKRQAVVELQRAVSAAETKALELVAAERIKMERLLTEARKHSIGQSEESAQANGSRDGSPSPNAAPSQNSCWNCGRKAQETCSGCNAARYCSAFCQHKDWENHHQVCCGRDQKPPIALNSSPTSQTPVKPGAVARSTTPVTTPTAERPLGSTAPNTSSERLGLSALISGVSKK